MVLLLFGIFSVANNCLLPTNKLSSSLNRVCYLLKYYRTFSIKFYQLFIGLSYCSDGFYVYVCLHLATIRQLGCLSSNCHERLLIMKINLKPSFVHSLNHARSISNQSQKVQSLARPVLVITFNYTFKKIYRHWFQSLFHKKLNYRTHFPTNF